MNRKKVFYASLAVAAIPLVAYSLQTDADGYRSDSTNNVPTGSRSFSVGQYNASYTDSATVGTANQAWLSSMAVGTGNAIYGEASFASGSSNSTYGRNITSLGANNSGYAATATANDYTVMIGGSNSNSGILNSVLIGDGNLGAAGGQVMGSNLQGEQNCVVLGKKNTTSLVLPDAPALVVGSGTSTTAGNAIEVYEGGKVVITECQGDIPMGIYGN